MYRWKGRQKDAAKEEKVDEKKSKINKKSEPAASAAGR
jgi:hypothetical protein